MFFCVELRFFHKKEKMISHGYLDDACKSYYLILSNRLLILWMLNVLFFRSRCLFPCLLIAKMSENLPEISDAHPTASLKEVVSDVSRIVQNYTAILAEKDKAIFTLHQGKIELETHIANLVKEKDQLSEELNSAVDALELLDKGTKDLQEKFMKQVAIMNFVEAEADQLTKACGFSVDAPSERDGSYSGLSNKGEHGSIIFVEHRKETNSQGEPEKGFYASLPLNFSFHTPSVLLSLRRVKEFVQVLRHDYTLMEVEVDRFALSSQESWHLAYDFLVDAEREARQLLVEEALYSMPLRFASHSQRRIADLYCSLKKEMSDCLLAREDEKRVENERFCAEEQRHSRECKKYRKQVEELERELLLCKAGLEKKNSVHECFSKQAFLWSTFLESSLVISQQRSDTAEKLWRQSLQQLLKRFSDSENQWKEKIKALEIEKQQFQDTIKKQSSMLQKQEKLAATYAKNMEMSTEKIELLNNEVETQKAKYAHLQLEKEEGRKKREAILQEHKTKNVFLESLVSQQKSEILQLKEGEEKLRKENAELHHRIHELGEVVGKLQPVAAKGEVLQELLQAAEQRATLLMEKWAENQNQKTKELEDAQKTIETLKISKKTALEFAEKSFSELQQDRDQREKDMAALQVELETLREAVHGMRLEKEEASKKLWMEQEARSILERQHSMEVDVIKRLVNTAEKGEKSISTVAWLQTEREELIGRISLLEAACRKSAKMIEELQESVCTERQLSAQLLSTFSCTSQLSLKCRDKLA